MPVTKTCEVCGKPFSVKPSHAHRIHKCSMACRKAANDVNYRMKRDATPLEKIDHARSMSAVTAKARLTPMQSAQVRGQIAQYMRLQIDIANQVVLGQISWNPTQARVFSTLLAKVVPDLSATYHQHEINQKDITELSREELEQIAAGIEEEARKTDVSNKSSDKRAAVITDARPTWEGDGSA